MLTEKQLEEIKTAELAEDAKIKKSTLKVVKKGTKRGEKAKA